MFPLHCVFVGFFLSFLHVFYGVTSCFLALINIRLFCLLYEDLLFSLYHNTVLDFSCYKEMSKQYFVHVCASESKKRGNMSAPVQSVFSEIPGHR